MAHRIGVSDYCTAITGGPIVAIVASMTTAKSMSPTTVLLESMTEPMLPNRCKYSRTMQKNYTTQKSNIMQKNNTMQVQPPVEKVQKNKTM